MRECSGNRSATAAFHLAVCALVGLLGANLAFAQQPPQPAPAAQPAKPADLIENSVPSQVFPEGGFPFTPSAPEGGIPASAVTPPPIVLPPAVPPGAPPYYAPPGYQPRDVQDVPGVPELFHLNSTPLPAYFYQQSYYEQPVVSPRSVIEYAPPGYEARDQQVTPGTPEFTLITPPTPVTPEERDKFVTRGIFPGSFLVPGTNTSFRIRGFVRLTALYDFNPIGSRDIFVTNTIPVPQTHGQNYNMAARASRIAFESWTPTSISDWTVHTFVEGDFFNGADQAVGGGGNPFRLRHAFIDFGYFRVGQQNSVFMDATTWPTLVDFQGPAGWVNQRRPGARVTIPLADKLFLAGAVEQPFSDITTNGLGSNVQDVPDFAAHLRYEADLGHVQVAGLMRSLGYQPTNGASTRRAGYGLSAGTAFHPWAFLLGSNPVRSSNPSALERCRIIGQYTFGWGIGRYILDTAGQGLDAQVDPLNGGFDQVSLTAMVVSYEQWFSEKWLSSFTYSQVNVGSNGGQPVSTYIGGKYLAANVWYNPVVNMSIGLEYLYGERENVNEQRGAARRVNALVQYNF